MPTRAKDKCPSCFQPIAPTDFLCPNCELILDPSQLPEKPLTEVSVVRRMLEAPQRSAVTAAVPDKKKDFKRKPGAEDAPTRKLDLGPELAGVPIVVASLTKLSSSLTELEAWLVSLIDGQSDAQSLAERASMREFELRVILRTLNEKHIIDFADEPLPDAALDPPLIEGTLTTQDNLDPVPDEDEPVDFSQMVPPAPVAVPVAPVAPVAAAAPTYGANVDRRDGRFTAPPARAVSVPPPAPARPPPPPVPSPPPAAVPPPPSVSRQAVQRPATPAEVPYPSSSRPVVTPKNAFAVSKAAPPAEPPPERQTDPRIAYTGTPNRKVLDALKKVKRSDGRDSSPPGAKPAPPAPVSEDSVADVLARDSLQIALRMEQSGRLDEAIRFLEKSIGKSPDAPSLYNRLGIIMMRERADLRRAEQLIRKATELAPGNTVYSQNLQQVLSRLALRGAR